MNIKKTTPYYTGTLLFYKENGRGNLFGKVCYGDAGETALFDKKDLHERQQKKGVPLFRGDIVQFRLEARRSGQARAVDVQLVQSARSVGAPARQSIVVKVRLIAKTLELLQTGRDDVVDNLGFNNSRYRNAFHLRIALKFRDPAAPPLMFDRGLAAMLKQHMKTQIGPDGILTKQLRVPLITWDELDEVLPGLSAMSEAQAEAWMERALALAHHSARRVVKERNADGWVLRSISKPDLIEYCARNGLDATALVCKRNIYEVPLGHRDAERLQQVLEAKPVVAGLASTSSKPRVQAAPVAQVVTAGLDSTPAQAEPSSARSTMNSARSTSRVITRESDSGRGAQYVGSYAKAAPAVDRPAGQRASSVVRIVREAWRALMRTRG